MDQEPPLIGDALSDGTAAQVLEDRQAPFDQLRVVCQVDVRTAVTPDR